MKKMKITFTQHYREDVLVDAPRLKKILTALQNSLHGYHVTTGELLPQVVPSELKNAPVMIVYSARMSDFWRPDLSEGHPSFTTEGLFRRGDEGTYWTWEDLGLPIAVNAINAGELLCDAHENNLPLLMVWVTQYFITLCEVWVDQEYLDLMAAAIQRAFSKPSTPSETDLESKFAQLPRPLSPHERRYISEKGEPVYIAGFVSRDISRSDRDLI
jgi:hypothetical protein